MACMSPPATTASHLKTLIGNPVDTGRKLNVHKTFNLRPVSTGKFVKANCVYASESSPFAFLENGINYNAMILKDIIRL